MRRIQYIFLTLMMILSSSINIYALDHEKKFIMGGNYVLESHEDDDLQLVDSISPEYDLERFFRPSNMTILNNEDISECSEIFLNELRSFCKRFYK